MKNSKSKLARTAFNRNIEKLTSKIGYARFTIITFPKFHLITVPKVMSTSLNKIAEDSNVPCYEANISKDTLKMENIKYHVNSKRKDGITKHFEDDWNTQLEGKSSIRDFIFLMRNPIDRFITGFYEDNMVNILHNFNHGDNSSSAWCRSLLEMKKYKSQDIDLFLMSMNVDPMSPWNEIENFKTSEIYDMYNDLVDSLINSHFQNIQNTNFYTHHTRPYLSTYLKFVSNKNIDESKIKFLDISQTDVVEYLNDTYKTEFFNRRGNERSNILREIITNSFKKHIITIVNFLFLDMDVYSQLCKLGKYENYNTEYLIRESLNKWYQNDEGLI